MPASLCRTCRKSIDIDPVKCPYCGVLQPNTAAAGPRPIQLAALLLAGLGVGLSAGSHLGKRLSPPPVMQFQFQPAAAPAGFEEGARRRAHGLGPHRLVEVEDLFLTPEKLLGEKVAVPGVIQDLKVGPEGARLELGSQWGSQARARVDVSGLNPEYLKTLLKRQDAFHVFLVKGEVLRGGPAPGGRGCQVRAQEIESVGETTELDGPARAARAMREELRGR